MNASLERRIEDRKKGRRDGVVEGMLQMMPRLLRLRFGPESAFFAEGLKTASLEVLVQIAAVGDTATLEEMWEIAG